MGLCRKKATDTELQSKRLLRDINVPNGGVYSGKHLGDQPWWETGTETALKWNNCSRAWCIFCKHSYVTRVLWKWFELLVFQKFGRNHQGMWGCYICSWLRMALEHFYLPSQNHLELHLLLCKVWSSFPGTTSWFLMLLVFTLNFTVGLENYILFFVCSVKGPVQSLNTGNLLNFLRVVDLIIFYSLN